MNGPQALVVSVRTITQRIVNRSWTASRSVYYTFMAFWVDNMYIVYAWYLSQAIGNAINYPTALLPGKAYDSDRIF